MPSKREAALRIYEKQMGVYQQELQAYNARQAVRAKAEFDAANFERRYTSQQKAEIAKWNRAEQDVDANPNFSEQEKVIVKRGIALKKIGIAPSDLPRLSPYAKGRDIGDNWEESGVSFSRKANGEVWQLDERKTVRGQAATAKFKLDAKQLAEQAKQSETMAKFRRDLFSQEITTGTDEFGKPIKRVRTPIEIKAILRDMEALKFEEPEESEAEGRARVAGMRDEAGIPPVESQGPIRIQSQDDYDLLESGAEFIGPDGVPRRKP